MYPTVTVIIPNYNHSLYLEQRIDSVLNQTFEKFYVVILDDNSDDNSKEVIEKYRDNLKVSQIIYNKKNSGSVFKQWEKGFDVSAGDYIWIAESDDYADPTFLEKMVAVLKSDSLLGFVYCNGVILKDGLPSGQTFADIRNKAFQTTKWDGNYINDGLQEIRENLLVGCTVNNASGVLFRRNALLEANPFDRDLKYVGDWYCYLKLCSKFKIGYVNEPLNYYRDHQVNASKNLQKNLRFINEYFQVYDWLLVNIPSLTQQEIKKYFLSYVSHSVLHGIRHHLKLYKKLLKQNPQLFSYMMKHNMKNHARQLKNRMLS